MPVLSRVPHRALRGPNPSPAAMRTIGPSSPTVTAPRGRAHRKPVGLPRPAGALLHTGAPTMTLTPKRRRSKGY